MIIKPSASSSQSMNSYPESGFVRSDRLAEKRATAKRLEQEPLEQQTAKAETAPNLQDSGSVGWEKRLAISEDNDHYKLQISRDGLQLQQAAQAAAAHAAEMAQHDAQSQQPSGWMDGGVQLAPNEERQKGVSLV